MIVINLWGEPGCGKSTTAAGLFFMLKINKFKVEMVQEVAKTKTWENHESFFGDQNSIFAAQNRSQLILLPHGLDFVITDSPLPLPLLYKPESYFKSFDAFVMETYNSYQNVNYLLRRGPNTAFETVGRRHNEEEAAFMAARMRPFLADHQIAYTELEANPKTPEVILADLRRQLPKPIAQLPFSEDQR